VFSWCTLDGFLLLFSTNSTQFLLHVLQYIGIGIQFTMFSEVTMHIFVDLKEVTDINKGSRRNEGYWWNNAINRRNHSIIDQSEETEHKAGGC